MGKVIDREMYGGGREREVGSAIERVMKGGIERRGE